jgi:hypothetical protein
MNLSQIPSPTYPSFVAPSLLAPLSAPFYQPIVPPTTIPQYYNYMSYPIVGNINLPNESTEKKSKFSSKFDISPVLEKNKGSHKEAEENQNESDNDLSSEKESAEKQNFLSSSHSSLYNNSNRGSVADNFMCLLREKILFFFISVFIC